MPPPRNWSYPPTRREITLLLFSLTVFVLSYNLETSLQLVGVHPTRLSSSYLSTIGIGTPDPGLDPDGRRPKEWRDELEDMIFGEWQWEEGKVSGVEREQVGVGIGNAAIYNVGYSKTVGRSAGREDRGIGLTTGATVQQQFLRWGSEMPTAKVVAHVPGYTILDNVLVANGTLFLVTDDASSLPSADAMASSALNSELPPRQQDLQVLNREEARVQLGAFGGRIFGTTWLSTDPARSQDPYTLFSLFRTHSTLGSASSSGFHSIPSESQVRSVSGVPAPLRLIFPHVPTFSSPHVPPSDADPKAHPPPRVRSYNGIHPLLSKAMLPTAGVWYSEDWQDLADMSVPWLFDRVVIADRGAADRGRERWSAGWSPPGKPAGIGAGAEFKKRAEGDEGMPSWAAPFVGLEARNNWWTPMRAALLRYLKITESQAGPSNTRFKWGRKSKSSFKKPVITYISMQSEPLGAGPRLWDEDHDALVAGLRGLEREGLVSEMHIVRGNGSLDVHAWEWEERMKAIARSDIVLGPYGFHLSDSIFMAPPTSLQQDVTPTPEHNEKQPQGPLVIEFFPPGTFVPDQEFAVRSLGCRYMAWWNDRKFSDSSLPPVVRPNASQGQRLSLDVGAVIQAIREDISRGALT
ncbi:hypothetical protein AcV7_006903 [Taiwanofungus camphoratus]|nr:hypothetical protein AcV7_006903 [Antrodia cinnamomea]